MHVAKHEAGKNGRGIIKTWICHPSILCPRNEDFGRGSFGNGVYRLRLTQMTGT